MTPITTLSIVCTVLSLLLTISLVVIFFYRRELKLQDWVCHRLDNSIQQNTDAIRELGDDLRQKDVVLNTEAEQLEKIILETLSKVLKNAENSL